MPKCATLSHGTPCGISGILTEVIKQVPTKINNATMDGISRCLKKWRIGLADSCLVNELLDNHL